jgi:hypothetical protein
MELVELRTLGNRARVRGDGEGMHDASTHEVVGDRCDRSLSGGARRGSGGSPSPALWSPGRRGLPMTGNSFPGSALQTGPVCVDDSDHHQTKGSQVNPTEHTAKTPSLRTGFRALLSSLHAFQGTGASNSQGCVADTSLSRHNQGAKVRQDGSRGL